MPVVSRTLTISTYAFKTAGVLCSLAAFILWGNAILNWGHPRPFSFALLWTLIALAAYLPAFIVDWVRNRGD